MNKNYHFCLNPLQSPTYYNLCRYLQEKNWHNTRFQWRADFSERNFQFNLLAAEQLEFKHLLAQLLTRYCLQVMPTTYCINDQNWPTVLSQITDEYRDDLIWILKPALLNNGQHIKIIQQPNQLEQHYISIHRLGGEHVLQRYITQPHLLRGHKYSIRMFVILTNYAGVYLYPHGYFNVALHPYQCDIFTDLSCHLTNEHLSDEDNNVVQIPTERFDFFTPLYQQIKEIVTGTIAGLQQQHSQAFVCEKQPALAIFGFDFMVDTDMRVWLLEANHGPCFPASDEHPLQKYLYYDFWQAFIASFVQPIAMHQPPEQNQFCRLG